MAILKLTDTQRVIPAGAGARDGGLVFLPGCGHAVLELGDTFTVITPTGGYGMTNADNAAVAETTHTAAKDPA